MATELITNGSFETGTGTSPTGWTGTANGGRVDKATGLAGAGTGYYAFSADAKAHGGALQQTIATEVGKTYTISFKSGVSWQPGTGKVDARIKVEALAGATVIEAQNVDLPFQKASGWGDYSFTFTATSSQTTLKFTDTSPNGQADFDVGLDAVSVQEAGSYKQNGEWGDLKPWPFVAIHAVGLPDGRILTYGSDATADPYNLIPKNAVMKHDIYDPRTGTHQTIDHTGHTTTDIFCSSAVLIPGTDQVMIVGGDTRPTTSTGYNRGVDDTNIFDTSTGMVNKSPEGDMNYARWYATTVSLPTGQVLTMGGIDQNGRTVTTPEIWTEGEGWRALTGATTADLVYYYPRMWAGKDGKIIYVNAGAGNNNVTEVMQLDPKGNGSLTKLGQLNFTIDGNSPAIMYESGKVLFMATDGQLWTMDMNGGAPVFAKSAKLSQNRDDANMTVMADGKVLINGGSSSASVLSTADKTATVWDPATGQLAYLSDEMSPRLYHSTALLMMDGTILSMGGGFAGQSQNDYLDSQIYKPSYLFDANGNPATRPVITSDTKVVAPGQSFTITVDDASAISKLTFVKTGATTHAFNMDANFVNLTFSKGANNTMTVTLPEGVDKVPAGAWMLFAWNNKGVPSIADMVDVSPTLTPFKADGSGGEQIDPNAPELGPELIVNGSLEQLKMTSTAGWQGYENGQLPGWKNLDASGVEVTNSSGSQRLDLDVRDKVDTIYQDIKTEAGKTYQLQFNALGAAGTSDFDVMWNGQVVARVNTTTAAKNYTFEVTGTGASDRLAFREVAAQNDYNGAQLDNVSLRVKGASVDPQPPVDPNPGTGHGNHNLLANGSFETATGATPNASTLLANGKVGAWQSSTNQIEVWNNGFNGVTGTDGKNIVEIDAHNGTLSQTIKTEAGKFYGISFDYAGRPDAIASSKMEVLWNGVVIGTVTPENATMKNYHFHAHGTGGNDVIAFRSVAGDTDSVGGLLDKVEFYVSGHGENPPAGSNAINGTAGDDYLVDTDGNDMIKAGAGNDTVFIGKGNDTVDGEGGDYNQVDLNGKASDYSFVRNADGTITVTSAAYGTDTLKNINGFWFYGEEKWYGADQLAPATGTPGGNPGGGTPGNGGVNVINAAASGGYVTGTDGADHFKGGAGTDVFYAGKGNDIVDGAGGDYNQVDLDGSAGDWTFTRNADGSVKAASTAYGNKTLTNIDGVYFYGEGKWYDAAQLAPLLASGEVKTINAAASGGYVRGTDGADHFKGGAGSDVFYAGKGNDIVDGAGGDYNQVDLDGSAGDWTFTTNADGSVKAVSATYGNKTLTEIDGVYFYGSGTWSALSDLSKSGAAVAQKLSVQAKSAAVPSDVDGDIDMMGLLAGTDAGRGNAGAANTANGADLKTLADLIDDGDTVLEEAAQQPAAASTKAGPTATDITHDGNGQDMPSEAFVDLMDAAHTDEAWLAGDHSVDHVPHPDPVH